MAKAGTTPERIASDSAAEMWAADAASKWFGMEMVETTPGGAVLTLAVQAHHCNGHGLCHGGVIFALADSAFAFACNSYGRAAVAAHNTISYLAPARAGDRLTATARETAVAGRSGVYDVTVARQSGETVAVFRGASRQLAAPRQETT